MSAQSHPGCDAGSLPRAASEVVGSVAHTIYPTKRLAMQAGEASRGAYTVEPLAERDTAKPWRLTLSDTPPATPNAAVLADRPVGKESA